MGLWKDKTRKHWCYSFVRQGKSYAARGFRDRREAEQARLTRKEELDQPISHGMVFSEVCNMYLDYSKKAHAKSTYYVKCLRYDSFFKFLKQDIPIADISTQIVSGYLNTRPTNNAYNTYKRDLSAMFTYARDILEVIEKNPCSKLKNLAHTPKPKIIPKEKDILKLLLTTDPETDEKDLLIVLLHTLARIDEALRLKWQDINFEKRTLTKWTKKTKDGSYKAVTVSVNQELYDTLYNRWQNRNQDTWVFFNPKTGNRYIRRSRFMKGLCKRAGIEPYFGFHALRHLMASLLADNPKVTTKTIQGILGHEKINTTEIYLHEVEGANVDAMDSISGKFTQKQIGCGYKAQPLKNKNSEESYSHNKP